MKKYSWKNQYFKGDAQKVGSELELIERSGSIDNKKVLQYARNNSNSELHKCFEWDDSIASEKYRLFQATSIISSISFEIEDEPIKKQKVYVSIQKTKEKPRQFRNIKEILEDDDEYSQLLRQAKKDLENCKDNYETLIKREDLKNIIFEIYKEV